jgi:hypothetical protein
MQSQTKTRKQSIYIVTYPQCSKRKPRLVSSVRMITKMMTCRENLYIIAPQLHLGITYKNWAYIIYFGQFNLLLNK